MSTDPTIEDRPESPPCEWILKTAEKKTYLVGEIKVLWSKVLKHLASSLNDFGNMPWLYSDTFSTVLYLRRSRFLLATGTASCRPAVPTGSFPARKPGSWMHVGRRWRTREHGRRSRSYSLLFTCCKILCAVETWLLALRATWGVYTENLPEWFHECVLGSISCSVIWKFIQWVALLLINFICQYGFPSVITLIINFQIIQLYSNIRSLLSSNIAELFISWVPYCRDQLPASTKTIEQHAKTVEKKLRTCGLIHKGDSTHNQLTSKKATFARHLAQRLQNYSEMQITCVFFCCKGFVPIHWVKNKLVSLCYRINSVLPIHLKSMQILADFDVFYTSSESSKVVVPDGSGKNLDIFESPWWVNPCITNEVTYCSWAMHVSLVLPSISTA